MFRMLSAFNLKPDVSFTQFQSAYHAFLAEMLSLGLATGSGPIGKRRTDTILDTDEARPQQYFALMEFADKAQSDRACDWITQKHMPGRDSHIHMWALADDMEFLAWEDLE